MISINVTRTVHIDPELGWSATLRPSLCGWYAIEQFTDGRFQFWGLVHAEDLATVMFPEEASR